MENNDAGMWGVTLSPNYFASGSCIVLVCSSGYKFVN